MSNFQIGDKVRVKPSVLNPTDGWGQISRGDVGVVKSVGTYSRYSIHDGEEKVIIDFDKHKSWCGYWKELELVSKNFEVGDKVQLISSEPYYTFGPHVKQFDIGEIKQVNSYNEIIVDFPNHKYWTGKANEFKLVESGSVPVEKKESKTMKKFVETTVTYLGETVLEKGLGKIFKNQGEMYDKVFGVPYNESIKNRWHPEDSDFNTLCDGFSNFIRAKGKSTATTDYLGYSKAELKLAIQILLFKEPTLQKIQLSINARELSKILQNIYKYQIGVYTDLFDIDFPTAQTFDLHPYDDDFDTDCCGFEKFVNHKGTFEPVVSTSFDYNVDEIKTAVEKLF